MRTPILTNTGLELVYDFGNLTVRQMKNLEFIPCEIDWDTKSVFMTSRFERVFRMLEFVDNYLNLK